MRIVFMGTPDFAVGCLESLYNDNHEIVAVFTQPDKPQGRKMVITPPPVKVKALELGLQVYQPQTFKDGTAQEILSNINPDLIVVVAYGKILPQSVLDIPKYGCVNVHASLLPRHRGASPIQWSIVCGDKYTGVCTMQMDAGMDTGDILLCEKTEICNNETAGELWDRLSIMGAELIKKTVNNLDNIKPIKQDESLATYAPIITKQMGLINFREQTAQQIYNLVRGFNPKPTAYFVLDSKRVKVFTTQIADKTDLPPSVVVSTNNGLVISCKDGVGIKLCSVQPEGSKIMDSADMLRGKKIDVGTMI